MDIKNINSILVAVDDSRDSIEGFHLAIRRAKQENAYLYIASVLDYSDDNVFQVLDADSIEDQRKQLKDHLESYREEAEKAGIPNSDIETIAAAGDKPGKVIVEEVIPEVSADLLIVGANSQSKWDRHFGSQASYMAENAPISVLVYRKDQAK